MIQAYFKGKSSVQFLSNEDFKTSSSIGLLQYLPDNVFWNIMKRCCVELDVAALGKIQNFNFWRHTDRTKTKNSNYVEPDVWIETENYDVIIEAKKNDGGGQYLQQWHDEIQSILNEQRNGNYQKPIILIALGGNENLQPESVSVGNERFDVFKTSWFDLINAIVTEFNSQENNGNVYRILSDVVELFAHQGVIVMKWLNNLIKYDVDETALCNWMRITNRSSVGLEGLNHVQIRNKNIQQWTPIK